MFPLGLLISCTGHAPAALSQEPVREQFWEHWADGQAEVTGYWLQQERYGAKRQGELVRIVVTEGFDPVEGVKSLEQSADPVLKVHSLRRFQTGIYDYALSTTAFLPLDGSLPLGQPLKLVFSGQEWCGQRFEQIRLRGEDFSRQRFSYLEGEGDRVTRHRAPSDGVFLDALPEALRGWLGESLAPGESVTLKIWERLDLSHLEGAEPQWREATLTRASELLRLEAEGGDHELVRWSLDEGGGEPLREWWIRQGPERRLMGWRRGEAEQAWWLGSERMAYWELQEEGDEHLRSQLGLDGGLPREFPLP